MPGVRCAIALVALLGLTAAAGAAGERPGPDQDRASVVAMRAQGMDLSTPQLLEFAFYFPDKAAARKVMGTLAGEGFSGELHIEGSDAFILFARKAMLVDAAALGTMRMRFEGLAKEAGGSYDGWGLP